MISKKTLYLANPYGFSPQQREGPLAAGADESAAGAAGSDPGQAGQMGAAAGAAD